MRKIYSIIIAMFLLLMVSCSNNSKSVSNNEKLNETFVVNIEKLNKNLIGDDVVLSQTDESISSQNKFMNTLYNKYDIDWISFQIDFYDNVKVVVKTKDERIKDDIDNIKSYALNDLKYFKVKNINIELNDKTITQINLEE